MARRRSMHSDPRFVRSGPQWAESETGFRVAFAGRFELEYTDGDRRLMIPIESLTDRELIELSRVVHWEPPYAQEVVTREQRDRIRENIAAAMRHLRTGFEIT